MGTRLFHNLDAYANNVAIVSDDGAVITYTDLLKRADRIGEYVTSRCLVLLVCENSVDCLAAYVGLHRAGAVLLLVHHSTTLEQLSAIEARFQPKFLAAPENSHTTPRAHTGHHFGRYVVRPTAYKGGYVLHDDLCLLLTTSGTTGSRSFVRQSYKNITSNADAIIQYLGINSAERAITTMPMSYTYGLSIIHSHLLAGASIVATEQTLMTPTFWPLVKESKVTSFSGVPFIYEMLKKLRFEKMELPAIRTLTQAGGRLSPVLVEEFSGICERKGIKFFVMYGQTEATARMGYLSPPATAKKPASIGAAIPGGRFELVDDAGTVIKQPNVPGELFYYGENVTMGYADGFGDLAKGDTNNGRLATGDIATCDAEGYYSITGRKKRFLKIFGYRVSLDEVEQILKASGWDCACGGVDDRLLIYVAGNPNHDQIKDAMMHSTSLTPQGYRIIDVAEIPRSESGKVDYARLKSLAEA